MAKSDDPHTTHSAPAESNSILKKLPINAIDSTFLPRDRELISVEALEELKHSIHANGLRLPIEVVRCGWRNGEEIYGLISGLRRLSAYRMLAMEECAQRWGSILAIIRPSNNLEKQFISMVEENEIRENLTPYERGRILEISVRQVVFEDWEQALVELFPQASRSKRSKIRSFAMIFQALDGVLGFAYALNERKALQLSAAIRDNKTRKIVKALKSTAPQNAEEEWSIIESAIKETNDKTPEAAVKITKGLEISYSGKPGKFALRFYGHKANDELKEAIMSFIRLSHSPPRS